MAGSHEDSLQDRIRSLGPRFLLYPEIRTPKDMIYLHRSLAGTYAMLRRLKTEADWGAMSRPALLPLRRRRRLPPWPRRSRLWT